MLLPRSNLYAGRESDDSIAMSPIWPLAKEVFCFGPLHTDDLVLTLTAGLGVLALLAMCKRLWREVPVKAGV